MGPIDVNMCSVHMHRVKDTLLLDIGNVLMHFDFGPARNALAAGCDAADDPLETLGPLKTQLERGEIDGAAFVDQAVQAIGFREGPDAFRSIWQSIFTPNEAMWDTVRKAQGRFRLFLLSDTSDLHRDALFRDFSIFRCFEGGVYSYTCHHFKPAPEIFRAAIDELRLVPAQTLWVDDRKPNVEAGAQAGFVSLLYDPSQHERFLREARAEGFDL